MDDWSDDKAIITMLVERGVDVSTPHNVDFYGDAESLEHSERIVSFLASMDAGEVSSTYNEETGVHGFVMNILTPLEFDSVVAIQQALNAQLEQARTKIDGWGVMNPQSSK